MKKLLSVAVAVAVLVGGGAFYGGMKYAQSKSRGNLANLTSEQRQQRMQNLGGNISGGFRDRGGMGGFVGGEIISKDDKSVTIKIQNGGSKIVFYSDTAEVGKFVIGTLADLKVGENITVNGVPNSDGSLTAKSIQIRPVQSLSK